MENAPSSADQAKLDKTLATPKGTPNTFVQGRPGNDSGTGGGDRLTALNSALEAQANKLRDIEVALIGRMESDGMPVLEEAFVRVKLAAQ